LTTQHVMSGDLSLIEDLTIFNIIKNESFIGRY
jgi:hypothetical protein